MSGELGGAGAWTPALYFEAHVTIAPVVGEDLEDFKKITELCGFRVAELLMVKGAETMRSTQDSFCTGRNKDGTALRHDTSKLVEQLRISGFEVRRWKIENTLVDERFPE